MFMPIDGTAMKFSQYWSAINGPIKIWIACIVVVFVAPSLLPPAVIRLVVPPIFCALVATLLIAWLRPRYDPMLRRAMALLLGETAWLLMEADALPAAMLVDVLAGFLLPLLLVWRPSRVLVAIMAGGVSVAAAKAMYLASTAPRWNTDTAADALHAVMRLTILLFAAGALGRVNRERDDARFEEELFSSAP